MGDRGIIFFVKMFASGWRRFLIWRTIPRIIGISFVCFYNIFRLRAKPRVPEKKRNDIHCFTRSSQGQNEKRTRMVTTLIIIFFSGTFFPRFSFAGFQYTPPCLRLVKKRGCRFQSFVYPPHPEGSAKPVYRKGMAYDTRYYEKKWTKRKIWFCNDVG